MRPQIYRILPEEGTLGNKAQNLLNNTPAIKGQGLNIPRSLVIPFEYFKSVGDPYDFILAQVDKYFPNWKRTVVRSSAPEEDIDFRFPGQF